MKYCLYKGQLAWPFILLTEMIRTIVMPAHNREATSLDHSILAYQHAAISSVYITFANIIHSIRAPKNEILTL